MDELQQEIARSHLELISLPGCSVGGRGAHEGSEHIPAAPLGCGGGCTMLVPVAAAGLNGLGGPF